jgi:hypothetical protein
MNSSYELPRLVPHVPQQSAERRESIPDPSDRKYLSRKINRDGFSHLPIVGRSLVVNAMAIPWSPDIRRSSVTPAPFTVPALFLTPQSERNRTNPTANGSAQ